MILINCFLITFIITTIWDISGFITELTKFIYEKLNPGKFYMGQPLVKPFGCSYCMTFWLISFYLLFNSFTIIMSISIGCLFTYIQSLMKKLLQKISNKINQL